MLFPAAGNITPDGWEPYSHTVGNTVSVRPGIYRYCKDFRLTESVAFSGLYVPRPFQHSPGLQLTFDCLEIALEKHVIHDPAIEEPLGNNP